ncbi:MAG: archease [Myxococcota bacterium]
MAQRGYRQIEHTADLALELHAPTEQALLAEGARAIVDVLTEGAEVAGEARRTVTLDALDREDRLVQWLNEILVLGVTDGFLYAEGTPTLDGEQGLRAEIRGEDDALERVRAEMKSVTYHDLSLEERDDGWTARVVIDV